MNPLRSPSNTKRNTHRRRIIQTKRLSLGTTLTNLSHTPHKSITNGIHTNRGLRNRILRRINRLNLLSSLTGIKTNVTRTSIIHGLKRRLSRRTHTLKIVTHRRQHVKHRLSLNHGNTQTSNSFLSIGRLDRTTITFPSNPCYKRSFHSGRYDSPTTENTGYSRTPHPSHPRQEILNQRQSNQDP